MIDGNSSKYKWKRCKASLNWSTLISLKRSTEHDPLLDCLRFVFSTYQKSVSNKRSNSNFINFVYRIFPKLNLDHPESFFGGFSIHFKKTIKMIQISKFIKKKRER